MSTPPDSTTDRELRETKARLVSLVDNHPYGFIALDLDGNFTSVNPAAVTMSGGYTEAELLEMNFADLLAEEDRARMAGHFADILATESKRLEVRVLRKDDTWGELELIGVPIVVDDEVIGVHGTLEDITERIRIQQLLDEALHAAEAANLAKSLFLATMSHEIRTPLTSVLAALELLDDMSLNSEQAKLWAIMDRSGQRLLGLVDEILDFSRIEAGKTDLVLDAFRINDLIAWTDTMMRAVVQEKGLEFSSHCHEELTGEVVGDAGRIHQVLTNLVGNAAKFTAEGSVVLQALPCEAPPGFVGVRFDVVDTGMGLTGEQQRLVFESFRQADASITRQYGGTGLGLAISRKLVALMGGAIEVASMPGRGSTFTVLLTLPRHTPSE